MNFQLGASLLDACVLAVLNREDTYGYVLTQNVQKVIEVSESTLYPVLRRLLKEELLIAYDQQFQGRNRKYYQITESGREKLGRYQEGWIEYQSKVNLILLGGQKDE